MKSTRAIVTALATVIMLSSEALGQWYNPHKWPFSLIPVPEVATDPNAGTTYGILPVFLFNNERKQIQNILAPDITEGTILGAGGTFRYLGYPSDDTQYYMIAGASSKIYRRVDVVYSTGRTRRHLLSFDSRIYFERDPTERFFGIGNRSRPGDQSNYTTEQIYGEGSVGVNVTPEFQVNLTLRPRRMRFFPGALKKKLPFIGKKFPKLEGLGGGSDFLTRLTVAYDTRDSIDIPRSGGLARVFAAVADRRLASSVSYTQFGAELRRYHTFAKKRVTLAGHLYLQYTPAGNETPFWAMSRLGGQESILEAQQTLRGYGAGRFVDNNLSVVNLEVRTRVYDITVFDTHGIIELAPFVEAGRVFHDADDNPANHLHPVGGIGFRGIAEPYVVGWVDVGYGAEGPSVFSGINYPF
jgi:hypothetical protein